MNPQTGEPSTAPSSARTSQESAELLEDRNLALNSPAPARMEVDREKRPAEPQPEAAATKWPRGHLKGDRKGEEPEEPDKNQALEPTGKASPRRPSQRRSGPGQTEQRGQGAQQRQNWWGQQQRRASDRSDCGYQRSAGPGPGERGATGPGGSDGALDVENRRQPQRVWPRYQLYAISSDEGTRERLDDHQAALLRCEGVEPPEGGGGISPHATDENRAAALPIFRPSQPPPQHGKEMCLKAKEMGLTDGTSYLYLKWNQKDHHYEPDTQEPLALAKAMEIVDYLVTFTSRPFRTQSASSIRCASLPSRWKAK